MYTFIIVLILLPKFSNLVLVLVFFVIWKPVCCFEILARTKDSCKSFSKKYLQSYRSNVILGDQFFLVLVKYQLWVIGQLPFDTFITTTYVLHWRRSYSGRHGSPLRKAQYKRLLMKNKSYLSIECMSAII